MERPKRPRTAFNFFFHHERQRVMANMSQKDGKVDLTVLSRAISAKWKKLLPSEVMHYANLANEETTVEVEGSDSTTVDSNSREMHVNESDTDALVSTESFRRLAKQ